MLMSSGTRDISPSVSAQRELIAALMTPLLLLQACAPQSGKDTTESGWGFSTAPERLHLIPVSQRQDAEQCSALQYLQPATSPKQTALSSLCPYVRDGEHAVCNSSVFPGDVEMAHGIYNTWHGYGMLERFGRAISPVYRRTDDGVVIQEFEKAWLIHDPQYPGVQRWAPSAFHAVPLTSVASS